MSQHKRNTDVAHQAIRKKSEAMFKRVIAIIDKMKTDKEPINYNNVAKVAGVSKSWLYRHNELNTLIDKLRSTQLDTRPASRSEMNGEHKNSIANVLKHRIQKLEAENKELKLQVEIMYGQLYLKNEK